MLHTLSTLFLPGADLLATRSPCSFINTLGGDPRIPGRFKMGKGTPGIPPQDSRSKKFMQILKVRKAQSVRIRKAQPLPDGIADQTLNFEAIYMMPASRRCRVSRVSCCELAEASWSSSGPTTLSTRHSTASWSPAGCKNGAVRGLARNLPPCASFHLAENPSPTNETVRRGVILQIPSSSLRKRSVSVALLPCWVLYPQLPWVRTHDPIYEDEERWAPIPTGESQNAMSIQTCAYSCISRVLHFKP